jgi:Pyridoxal-phosphate dependent enzyme
MFEQKRLGDNGTSAATTKESGDRGDKMNKQHDQVAHLAIVPISTSVTRLGTRWDLYDKSRIRHRQVSQESDSFPERSSPPDPESQHEPHRADSGCRPHDEGIGIGRTPPLWQSSLVDEIEAVSTNDAEEMARRLAREEGLFAGTSSGANVVAAIRVAERRGRDSTVVTLMVDSGLKYLSTDVYRNRSEATSWAEGASS